MLQLRAERWRVLDLFVVLSPIVVTPVGLRVSTEKVKAMKIRAPDTSSIPLNNTPLEDVESFTYLGNVI